MSSNDLDGRRAVVAGGSRGTGLAARRLRDAGAAVVTIARTPPETADPLFVRADLSTPEGASAAVAAVADLMGVPDIVVHVTGGAPRPAGTRPSTTTCGRRSSGSTCSRRSGWTGCWSPGWWAAGQVRS